MKNKLFRKHTPLRMQIEAEDCGIVSLSMILEYYNKYISPEELRCKCDTGRDGISAYQICQIASDYDLAAKPTSCNLSYLKNNCTYPAILHWEFNHFVVLDGFSGTKAIINDPAKGRIYVKPEELNKAFTGICIEFKKTAAFKAEGKKWQPFKYIKNLVKLNKSSVSLLILLSLLASIPTIAIPLYQKYYFDNILDAKAPNSYLFFISFLLLILFQFIASGLFEAVKRWFKNSLATTSSIKYMDHCLRLPLSFFSGTYASELIARCDDNDFISDTITNQIISSISSIILLIIYFLIMVRNSLVISITTFPLIGIELLGFIFANRIHNQLISSTLHKESKLTSTTINGIEIIENIKAIGAESGFFSSWSGLKTDIYNTKAKHTRTTTFNSFFPSLIRQIASFAILALGIFAIEHNQLTLGTLMAFQAFFAAFLAPAQKLLTNSNELNHLSAILSRYRNILSYPEDVNLTEENEGSTDIPQGDIELKNVTFGYSKSNPPIIENLSLKINKGEKIAFVGLSGSGKSTIFKLLLGLYQPWKGEVLFDGKARKEYNHNTLVKAIAVSSQNNIFFEDSVLDNIKMWDEDIKQEEIIQCCKKAYIHDTINKRSQGYNEIIKAKGKNFSGGELQRLEIARLLASKANILLLDETTSALDAFTEQQVLKSVFDLNLTTILISHRISAIKDMDKIFVFDNGKIVEVGKHDQLFASGGLYSKLVTTE